ncbi:hypothetical protein SAMN04487897_109142 [Paenibacillus sp. yr247]|uniref:hypothetical protein n=1 Tax=Paenibacillus sp. yr247 TaxID=1761880 RepID=UPI0008871581|nr:hypothetical protein [Paenibacillus sp. yr247]SDO18577.1 hypothetical protein SAMN04487897_109142 [Paenibacillus sp. yr247]
MVSGISVGDCVTSSSVQDSPVCKITRKFVGDRPLNEVLQSVLQSKVDNIVEAIYHATQANTVTSHTLHTEGAESI